jgi:energy-coupling factor transport system ATP-binding protein
VSLAAALVHYPKVLILDEYDSHLDAASSDHMEDVIRDSKASYVLRCTQHMETAASSDYLIFLERGVVKHAGTPETVFPFLTGTSFYPLSWRCPV